METILYVQLGTTEAPIPRIKFVFVLFFFVNEILHKLHRLKKSYYCCGNYFICPTGTTEAPIPHMNFFFIDQLKEIFEFYNRLTQDKKPNHVPFYFLRLQTFLPSQKYFF